MKLLDLQEWIANQAGAENLVFIGKNGEMIDLTQAIILDFSMLSDDDIDSLDYAKNSERRKKARRIRQELNRD